MDERSVAFAHRVDLISHVTPLKPDHDGQEGGMALCCPHEDGDMETRAVRPLKLPIQLTKAVLPKLEELLITACGGLQGSSILRLYSQDLDRVWLC